MANSPSARKRIRTNEARAEINNARRTRVRTFIKATENAIAAGDKDAASEAFNKVFELDPTHYVSNYFMAMMSEEKEEWK